MKQKDVSIIIPIYNSTKVIRQCVESVLYSDFDKNFEIIVVDDGSKDDSLEKINDLDVKAIKQENQGSATARNNGAKAASSDIIIFVDSDVEFFPDTLKRMHEHLIKDEVDYLSVIYDKRSINKKLINKYKGLADYCYYYDFIRSKKEKHGLMKQVMLSGGTEGWKKKVFFELGGFDEKIKGADVERERLLLKLMKNHQMLADPTIRTRHNFPDFKPLIKNYYYRTLHTVEADKQEKAIMDIYSKNSVRAFFGGLTIFLLILSIIALFIFKTPAVLYFTLASFLIYLWLHNNLFYYAWQEYGFFFMLYSVVMNLFFSTLVCYAGFLGYLKRLFK